MHQHPPGHNPREHDERHKPRLLSQSDPPPKTSTGRWPTWLIVVIVGVVVVVGYMLAHHAG